MMYATLAFLVLVGAPAFALTGAGTVIITRDPFGIPHVVGDTREAMAFGAGYALATDRLFETDVIRRLAQGRLSEILGAGDNDATLIADETMRREFYDAADIDAQYNALPVDIRRMLQAFADGFNAALAAQQANPAEQSVLFAALGYEPDLWRPQDSVSVLMLFTMVTFAGEGAGGELENAALLADLMAHHPASEALANWNDLLLSNDPDAPAVVPFGEGPPAPTGELAASAPDPAQVSLALLPGIAAAASFELDLLHTMQAVLSRLPLPKIGSYGVAATGRRTASGVGLLLGSPQAGFLAPAIFYELGLHGPGIDCTGFTVPGLGPFIGIGWCNEHAWTLIAGNAGDQVDTYVEELNPDDSHQYKFNGAFQDMTVRTETYVVKSTTSGQPPRIVTQDILSTVHGPVFLLDGANHRAFVFRRAQRSHFAESFNGTLALNASHSFTEFETGLRTITATYNLLYANQAGDIAYRFTGWQPVRARGADLRLPVPGTGEFEWRALTLPFDEMPHVTNPRRGLLNVDQGIDSKPIQWWPRASDVFIGRIGHMAGDQLLMRSDRSLDIERLELRNRQFLSDLDTVTARLSRLIVGALAGVPAGSDLGQALALFSDWKNRGFPRVDADGDGKLDHPAIAIFGADYFDVPISPVWDDFMDRIWTPIGGRQPRGTYIGRLGQTLAAVESPTLFSQPYAAGWQTKFQASLTDAIAALRTSFGGIPLADWRVPAAVHTFTAVGVAAPPPMHVVDHGSYSQIVDLGAARGVNVMPPGNGRADRAADVAAFEATGALPRHFTDQIDLYTHFAFKPMRMTPATFSQDAESVQTLVYPGTP